ncbi:hypothetical protein H4R33_003615 [Dimargaris cristalligena]|uniref:Uncharacterized protein n=1 Tax=Dimargaris cristalligena TaxID=215637 RepID=A0A4Q0A2A6_9FUNG|nr:hypothetical protein H4R33_003615 [Dimargaris cristalligena]RKP39631.1 hypothetical protein BJ085DRAFT_29449 [Dimargaris cristalligena]|eukprot:RKP39631.1 hypothetical protein BJ085DRAFT_29449 [Dimargaris cristalligena]
MRFSKTTLTFAVAAMGISTSVGGPMNPNSTSQYPNIKLLSRELGLIIAHLLDSETRGQLLLTNRQWRGNVLESAPASINSLGQTIVPSVQEYSRMVMDKGLPADELNLKGTTLIHDWMALLKHETLFLFKKFLVDTMQSEGPNSPLGYYLALPIFQTSTRDVVMVDDMPDKTLYTMFPMLQLANEYSVADFTKLVDGVLGPNVVGPVTSAFTRTVGGGNDERFRSLFWATMSMIREDLYYSVTWHLYQQVTDAQLRVTTANSARRPGSVTASFDKIKELFTTVLVGFNRPWLLRVTRNNYAMFGLILAARKFALYVPSHPELAATIHSEAAFYNGMIHWVESNGLDEDVTLVRQIVVDCLHTYGLYQARDYLIANWPRLDKIVEVGVAALTQTFAPFEVDESVEYNDAECTSLLFDPKAVNFWDDSGFGMNVIKSAIPMEIVEGLKFQSPEYLPDLHDDNN